MNLLRNFFILTLIIGTWSCHSADQNQTTVENDIPIVRKEMDSEVSKTVANLSIEGMTCSMGCGGKIQQELRAIQGVSETTLDFADNRPINVVTVQFDPATTDESKLIQCVNGIADGQYKVKSVEVVRYRGLQSHGKSTDVSTSSWDVGRVFELLNLLQSVTRLVEH